MSVDRTLTAKITPFGLRLQPKLKARLEKAAAESERSLNSEIAKRLELSFRDGVTLEDQAAFFDYFKGDVASVARAAHVLSEFGKPLYSIMPIDHDLAARMLPDAEAANRTVSGQAGAVLNEVYPDPGGPTYSEIAAELRTLVSDSPERKTPALAEFLEKIESRISAGQLFGEVKP